MAAGKHGISSVLATAAGILACLLVPAIAGATPQALYQALLTTQYRDSELPSGFFSARVGLAQPSSQAKRHHVIGEVAVGIDGPGAGGGIVYAIFPTAAEASADLHTPPSAGQFRSLGSVPGYPAGASAFYTGSVSRKVSGKTVTNGVTALAVRAGNVLVVAITTSTSSRVSGNVPGAFALLKSGIGHLSKVEAAVKRSG